MAAQYRTVKTVNRRLSESVIASVMDCKKDKELKEDDVWDDSLLIRAYDESVKLAKEQLAKRIADSTNKLKEKDRPAGEPKKESFEVAFKVGDYVRSTYDDGVDYEAKILSINESEGTCLLRYVGYENEQEVELRHLIPSWGKKARRMQFIQSRQDPTNNKDLFGGKEKKNKMRQAQLTELCFGAVPPPPPMPPMLNELSEDSEHLSAMLMSWYMSGYYTGLYHGRKMARNKGKVAKK